MHSKLSKLFMATGAAAALATSAIPRPAAADTTSTMETLLGAAAVIGGIVISNNIRHKQAQANQVVGYTANGGTVYADGRIVMPNGQTYYPNANGQNQIAQYGYNNGYNPNAYGYSTNPGYYNNTGNYGYNGNTSGYAPNQTLYYPKPAGYAQNRPVVANRQDDRNNGRWNGNAQNNGRWNANGQNNGRGDTNGRGNTDRDDRGNH
jgi:hypothetical protein